MEVTLPDLPLGISFRPYAARVTAALNDAGHVLADFPPSVQQSAWDRIAIGWYNRCPIDIVVEGILGVYQTALNWG